MKLASYSFQVKAPKRKIPSEGTKQNVLSDISWAADAKRKFPSDNLQGKTPKPTLPSKIPRGGYRAKAPERAFPSERFQAGLVQRRWPRKVLSERFPTEQINDRLQATCFKANVPTRKFPRYNCRSEGSRAKATKRQFPR